MYAILGFRLSVSCSPSTCAIRVLQVPKVVIFITCGFGSGIVGLACVIFFGIVSGILRMFYHFFLNELGDTVLDLAFFLVPCPVPIQHRTQRKCKC